MDKLKCMLGRIGEKGPVCIAPIECRHCGHEIHEARLRKQKIDTYRLVQREDGLRGLVIRR